MNKAKKVITIGASLVGTVTAFLLGHSDVAGIYEISDADGRLFNWLMSGVKLACLVYWLLLFVLPESLFAKYRCYLLLAVANAIAAGQLILITRLS